LRIAKAETHGAITIVNAMATGKGAALGINLWTRATVTLTNQPGKFRASNLTDPHENADLAEITAKHVFASVGMARHLGAVIETESNIPVAVGLKSGSAASNAVALASLHALGRSVGKMAPIRFGVEASLRTGVTLTGAFDDACASYLGGLVVTDNVQRKVLKRFKPKDHLRVLIHVPQAKMYTRDVDPKPFKVIEPLVQVAHQEALRGNYWTALTLNGLAYSTVLHKNTKLCTAALNAGAMAAGLTGKGPAIVAVVPASRRDAVLASWKNADGRVIETSPNFRKANAWSVSP
jgi:shikimate kinase